MFVLMDILIIRDGLTSIEKYPNDPAMHTPMPAIVFPLLVTIYVLYVALQVKD